MRPVSMVSSLPPTITPSRTYVITAPLGRSGRFSLSVLAAWVPRGHHGKANPRPVSALVFPLGKLLLCLLADAERVDQATVPVHALRLEIVEQSTPLSHELQQPAARVVVLCVHLEVLGEVRDALGEERYLHLGRPGVALVLRECLDRSLLATCGEAHAVLQISCDSTLI